MIPNETRGLIRFLGRHLIALGVTYIALDDNGKRTGPERFFAASGFIMEFGGQWYFATAGHVLQEEIAGQRRRHELEIVGTTLIAFFGHDNPLVRVIPVDYDSMPKAFVDDRDLGLDVGLIQLTDL